jgi:hypothetical protein
VIKAVLPAAFLLSALGLLGSTVGTTPCSSGTLASYSTSYAYAPPLLGCSIGILDYSNFTYVGLQNAPAASDIAVAPASSGNGFMFSQVGGSPFVANGDIVQFAIYYNIFIDPAPVIPGASTHLDPPVGNVSITEYFCNDSVLYPGNTSCFPPTSPAYSLTVTTASPDASITFNPPAMQTQTVGVIFTLNGLTGIASFDGLETDTAVAAAPEPASFALVGLVMLFGGYKLKKRSN